MVTDAEHNHGAQEPRRSTTTALKNRMSAIPSDLGPLWKETDISPMTGFRFNKVLIYVGHHAHVIGLVYCALT